MRTGQVVNFDELTEKLVKDAEGNFDKPELVASNVRMLADGYTLDIEGMQVGLSGTAERNIGERIGVPSRTLFNLFKGDLLDLRVTVFNRVVQKLQGVKWFGRFKDTGSGIIARALLSAGYTDASNLDVVYAVADALAEHGGFVTYDTVLDEKEFWARFVIPDITLEIRPGQTWVGAVRVCNSEVGHRAATVIAHLVKEENGAYTSGLTFTTSLKDTRVPHRNNSTEKILDNLRKSVPEVLSKLEGYLYKLRDFSELQVQDPLRVLEIIAQDHSQITKSALEAMKTAWQANPGNTGLHIIEAIVNAPKYTDLQWEDELYLERLAAKMVTRKRIV